MGCFGKLPAFLRTHNGQRGKRPDLQQALLYGIYSLLWFWVSDLSSSAPGAGDPFVTLQ